MHTRQAHVRYGRGAGFNVGRINHVKINNPKPFPAPPPTPNDLRGVRHAQLQEKNENNAKNENKDPATTVHPRTKYHTPTKKERFLKSLGKAFTPPEELQAAAPPEPAVVAAGPTVDPRFPGGLTFYPSPPVARRYRLPEFGAETTKYYADTLRTLDLNEEDMRVLRVFEALKIQGQTRERYHENETALDLAVELQPQREKYRALDCAAAAKREKQYQRKLAEAKEREEQERKRQEELRAEEERKRQEREDENNRRIAETHRLRQEERIYREKMREEERQRKARQQQERARVAAEARRVEEARRAKEAEAQRKRDQQLREARERREMEEVVKRLRAEREEAMRRAEEQEKKIREAVMAERRAALEALRQATREANEMIAQIERDQAAKDAFVRAAEYRANLMEQELRAREQQQWAQAKAFMEQLEQAHLEHAMLEQAFREAQQRAFFEEQHRAAREAQERAEREQQEAAARAAQEAQERAAQAAREAEAAAHRAQVAQYICQMYDHKWTVLKTRKDIDGQVPYCDFPIPWFPFLPHVDAPFPPAPQPSEISIQQVREFVLSPYRQSMEGKTPRERIRAEMLFWHPDKFESKFLRLMKADDKAIAMEAVNVLSRILTQIKEDVEREEWLEKKAKEDAEKAASGAA